MAKLTWEDQETLNENPDIIDKNKFTALKANEARDSINALYDLLPFPLTTDITGIMQDVSLEGRKIGTIIGAGTTFEVGVHFTKDEEDDIITMIAPNTFVPLTKYRLIPEQ